LTYSHIKASAEGKKGKLYLFLDEVQELEGWEKLVNSCMIDFDDQAEVFARYLVMGGMPFLSEAPDTVFHRQCREHFLVRFGSPVP